MTKRHLIIATRESPLAMRQAELVRDQLQTIHPHLAIDFLGITTEADKMLSISLSKIGGKGLFVKELEMALLEGKADIAVHSMKDMPMDLPPGLSLPVMCEREDPRDVFVANNFSSFMALPQGAVIGTSSLRRQTQLKSLRPDLLTHDLRGNIQTRLKRLDEGVFDAIVLAGAGLRRMQLTDRIRAYFSIEEILPAAGQGALGIECRENDEAVLKLIEPLNHLPTFLNVTAERATCKRLGGGCTAPVAAFADTHHKDLTLRALVAGPNGVKILRAKRMGEAEQAKSIGERVAHELHQQGAQQLLKAFL